MVSHHNFDPKSSYYFYPASFWYQSLTSIRDQSFLFVQFGTVLCVNKFTNPTTFNPFYYSLYQTTLLRLWSDRSVAPAPKLDTSASSIDAATSIRIEIAASLRIETAAPEVATTSFDLCNYYFVVIHDSHAPFDFPNHQTPVLQHPLAILLLLFQGSISSGSPEINSSGTKHQVWHKKRA